MGFTLRDLWMMLNPKYAQQWREQQAMKLQKPGYNHEGNMEGSGGLYDLLRRKHYDIDNNPDMKKNPRPLTLQDYYNEMNSGYNRIKYPRDPEGYY